MFQNTLRTEHLLVGDAVEFDFFGGVSYTVLDPSSLWDRSL